MPLIFLSLHEKEFKELMELLIWTIAKIFMNSGLEKFVLKYVMLIQYNF